ncbi:hypothetical protein HDU93_003948 [Gonapodya sp. JEL0774]|nr:hypothetical protein HDU93_003948 [Gonapodya sp. JEL0774]
MVPKVYQRLMVLSTYNVPVLNSKMKTKTFLDRGEPVLVNFRNWKISVQVESMAFGDVPRATFMFAGKFWARATQTWRHGYFLQQDVTSADEHRALVRMELWIRAKWERSRLSGSQKSPATANKDGGAPGTPSTLAYEPSVHISVAIPADSTLQSLPPYRFNNPADMVASVLPTGKKWTRTLNLPERSAPALFNQWAHVKSLATRYLEDGAESDAESVATAHDKKLETESIAETAITAVDLDNNSGTAKLWENGIIHRYRNNIVRRTADGRLLLETNKGQWLTSIYQGKNFTGDDYWKFADGSYYYENANGTHILKVPLLEEDLLA